MKSLLGGVRTRTVPVVRPSTSKRISFVASTLPSTIEVASPAGRLLAVSALQVTTPAALTALTLSVPVQVAAWIVVESALGMVTVRSAVGSVTLMKVSRRFAVAPSKTRPDWPKTPALAARPTSPESAWE